MHKLISEYRPNTDWLMTLSIGGTVCLLLSKFLFIRN